jgi:hypothetical protein
MSITVSDILDYVKNYRMSKTQFNNITLNNDNKGVVAINSAFIFVQSGFLKINKTETFDDFYDNVIALNSSDLISLSSLRKKLTATEQMCFEAVINYTLYQLYAVAEEEEVAKDKKDMAQNLLDKVIGHAALDATEGLKATGSGSNIIQEPVIVAKNLDTTSAKSTITGGFSIY